MVSIVDGSLFHGDRVFIANYVYSENHHEIPISWLFGTVISLTMSLLIKKCKKLYYFGGVDKKSIISVVRIGAIKKEWQLWSI